MKAIALTALVNPIEGSGRNNLRVGGLVDDSGELIIPGLVARRQANDTATGCARHF